MLILKVKLDDDKIMKLVMEEIAKTIDLTKFEVSPNPIYTNNGFVEVYVYSIEDQAKRLI